MIPSFQHSTVSPETITSSLSLSLSLFQLAELRQECEARGLDTKGNKGELIGRLQTYLEEHGEAKSL